MMALEPVGAGAWQGTGPRYAWGGLYGGQIVAQALWAATATVDPAFGVHSLHAYFIRAGDHAEPVRFEVTRVRDGRSLCTRRVAARQAPGVLLEMTASYQLHEEAVEAQVAVMPPVGPPGRYPSDGWSPMFDRRPAVRGPGESSAWMRLSDPLGGDPVLSVAGLAYLSDDLPTEAVASLYPGFEPERPLEHQLFAASLDHSIHLHRPAAPDRWHLHSFTCDGVRSARGVGVGRVFAEDGAHVATIVQEVLLRPVRGG